VEVTVRKLRKPAIVYIVNLSRCGKCCQVLAAKNPKFCFQGVVLSQSTFYLVIDCRVWQAWWTCNVRIDARRNELRARREKALEKCREREKQLEAAQGLQEFKRDADEVRLLSHICRCQSYLTLSYLRGEQLSLLLTAVTILSSNHCAFFDVSKVTKTLLKKVCWWQCTLFFRLLGVGSLKCAIVPLLWHNISLGNADGFLFSAQAMWVVMYVHNCQMVTSNGSLPPGGWLIVVTCGLTACTLGSDPGPTLGNEYGKPLPSKTGWDGMDMFWEKDKNDWVKSAWITKWKA